MQLQRRVVVLFTLLVFVAATGGVASPALAVPWQADENAASAVGGDAHPSSVVLAASDTTDLESHGGYTSQYIFGLTKGVMRSTLVPALKPVALLFTVPLDLAFLPFAAIGGFFR